MWAWLSSLVQQLLQALGLWAREGTVVLVGLDNAGKTTLLNVLRTGRVQTFAPTEVATQEEFQFGGVTFRAWDLGGQEAVRHLWEDYFLQAQGIAFLVDAADEARFEEAREELADVLAIADVPVAVLLNKCDLAHAADMPQLQEALGLPDPDVEEGPVPLRAFRTSLVAGEGYQEAFRWLAEELPVMES